MRVIALIFLLANTMVRAATPSDVRFTQRLGNALPLQTVFADETGRQQELKYWFRGRPVFLWFGYSRCPQLCGVVADGMVTTLRSLRPSVGKDFDVIRIGIDPTETTRDAAIDRGVVIGHYGRSGAAGGWHYLVGSERAIATVTAAAGFGFRADQATREYAHPSGFVIVTPDGRISSYFLGVDFSADDVAAAFERARGGGIGQKVFDLLLLCFRGDAIGGKYGVVIWRVLWAGVLLTVASLGLGIGRMLWTEFRTRKAVRT
ncbi:MAG TPA: SCO family protein [Candidatus Didemnitutus sp.]|nr:SCO family protein [Candidatus Didemnitutus sp.]